MDQQRPGDVVLAIDINVTELFRCTVADDLDALEVRGEVVLDQRDLWQRQGLVEVPQQLVQAAHDREQREHTRPGGGILSPGLSGERVLRHFLSSSETIEDGAPFESAWAQFGVDAAGIVFGEVAAGFPCGLVERKVARPGECQSDTAETKAAGAVGSEVLATTELYSCS